jgi:hypothetical protein
MMKLAALAVGALALSAQPTYDLTRVAEKDQKMNYDMAMTITAMGMDLEGSARMIETVTVAEENKLVTETVIEDLVVVMNGQDMEMPAVAPVVATMTDGVVTFKPGRGSDFTGYNIARMTSFIPPKEPVSVGDTWTVVLPGDPDLASDPVTIEYKVEKEAAAVGLQALQVDYTAELDAEYVATTANGSFFIDVGNGRTLMFKADIKDLITSQGPVDMVIEAKKSTE